jgi:hypothetical protein
MDLLMFRPIYHSAQNSAILTERTKFPPCTNIAPIHVVPERESRATSTYIYFRSPCEVARIRAIPVATTDFAPPQWSKRKFFITPVICPQCVLIVVRE